MEATDFQVILIIFLSIIGIFWFLQTARNGKREEVSNSSLAIKPSDTIVNNYYYIDQRVNNSGPIQLEKASYNKSEKNITPKLKQLESKQE